MRLADSHLHLFARGFAGTLGSSPAGCDELEAYERLRAHYGIELGLVIGYEGEPRYAGNNEELLALAARRSWVVPLAYLPIAKPPRVESLRDLSDRGAAGFAMYLSSGLDCQALCDWPTATFAELCRQRALMSINAAPGSMAYMERVIDNLEGCRVLFSHLGSPGRFARAPTTSEARDRIRPLLALASRPDVAVKVSGLYAVSDPPHDFPHDTARPFVELLLESFSPSRLMWGSDFSPMLDYVSFAQALDIRALAGCTSAELEKIMGANLRELLEDNSTQG
jgi:L-fuconolactonase